MILNPPACFNFVQMHRSLGGISTWHICFLPGRHSFDLLAMTAKTGGQDKLAPATDGQKELAGALSPFPSGHSFHTYIHLILAFSLRLQVICVEC